MSGFPPAKLASLKAFGNFNPAGTTNIGGVMMGLGSTVQYTMTSGTTARITWQTTWKDTALAAQPFMSARCANKALIAPPANGAGDPGALTPTPNTSLTMTTSVAGDAQIVLFELVFTGLTPGATYWFDLILGGSGGTDTTTITNVTAYIQEYA